MFQLCIDSPFGVQNYCYIRQVFVDRNAFHWFVFDKSIGDFETL